MTKICESCAGGFARVGRTLGRRPPQPVEGVSRLQKSADIFISGLLAVLAGTAATAGNTGEECAVCETCKRPVWQGFAASC